MKHQYHNIAIALAGLCQSAMLVPQFASTGVCSASLYRLSIKTLFNTSPKTTDDVYGGIQHIESGLRVLKQILFSGQKENVEIIRYLFGALNITSKLLKNQEALNKVDQRLARISALYPAMDDETIGEHVDDLSYSLAGIYSDIISPLSSKIKVTGKVEFLQNSLVQAKVRTALFACIRSATLWYQVGGKRLQFIFFRKKISNAIDDLLNAIEQTK